ncbi:MAG: hypothetical protein JWO35_832 [Candidatus Saccharibacteria bacterium]|nr:hypothetical protein [Candidatus Saccharibacteria bacterium]
MAEPKKIVDVAHPNKSAPSGNSKSVIVTHRPMMQDPMVNKEATETAAPAKDTKLRLQPLTAPVLTTSVKEQAEETTAPVEAAEPAKPVEPAEVESAAPAKHVKLELKPLADTEKTAPAPDAPEDQGDKGNAIEINPEVADEEQVKADAALQKLVDSKQYFLPINTLESRRSRRFVAIGIILSLIMLVAWADIALDAGLITIEGVKPLTNLFST